MNDNMPKWEDNTQMYLKQIACPCVYWALVAQDWVEWQVLFNKVIMRGYYKTTRAF